jgi:hypothetical protein
MEEACKEGVLHNLGMLILLYAKRTPGLLHSKHLASHVQIGKILATTLWHAVRNRAAVHGQNKPFPAQDGQEPPCSPVHVMVMHAEHAQR